MNEPNYDESKVPRYRLPDVLSGSVNAFEWMNFRREEILRLYQDEVFGPIPPRPDRVATEILSSSDHALGGTAIRKEIRLHFSMNNKRNSVLNLLFYAPKSALQKPVPAFFGLNFKGNAATTMETDLAHPGLLPGEKAGIQAYRWQFEEAVKHGFASLTACYCDLFWDSPEGWTDSIYKLFTPNPSDEEFKNTHGAISAWSWGLMRMLDYLESEPLVDARRVAVHGHSRLGKTSLWAGANDPRMKMVISNCSGCMGSALSRRRVGETVSFITNQFPHWFVKKLSRFSDREAKMPYDQHFLLSLTAPRPLCVASATEDLWADPKGEFLAAKAASEVWKLFGKKGLSDTAEPEPDVLTGEEVNYHRRTGKHDQQRPDWDFYFALAGKYLR